MSEDNSEDDERNNVGIRKLQQTQDGDEDSLTNQVNDAADALVVAVVLQAPLVPCPHIVVANGHLSKERKIIGHHDSCVGQQEEPFVIVSFLEEGLERVLGNITNIR